MNKDNQQVFFCEDGEHRVDCNICYNLGIEQFYKNHLKSKTHTNIIRKRDQLNKSFQIVSLI